MTYLKKFAGFNNDFFFLLRTTITRKYTKLLMTFTAKKYVFEKLDFERFLPVFTFFTSMKIFYDHIKLQGD